MVLEKVELQIYFISKGVDYGVILLMIQFQVYCNVIQVCQKFGLFYEVEWVQYVCSYVMICFVVEYLCLCLGGFGQLNVILLFGFLLCLLFLEIYQQFCVVIESVKSLEYDIGEFGVCKCKVSIMVGVVVMLQYVVQYF